MRKNLSIFAFLFLSITQLLYGEAEIVPQTVQDVHFSFRSIVKKTAPAVVTIFALQATKPIDEFALLYEFMLGEKRQQVNRSMGSGVIIRSDGLIVTCAHVVQRSSKVRVRLADNRELDATLVSMDPTNDLAILKLNSAEKEQFPFIEMGNSAQIEAGDLVLALGNPFGVGRTVTNGIISSTEAKVGGRLLLQTDAPINPGNSGGALVDINGQLIGIPNAIFSKTGTSLGIGFAIPVSLVKGVIDGIQKGGKAIRAWHGIRVLPLNTGKQNGVVVKKLHSKSPAAIRGLKTGDIITQVGKDEITSVEDFNLQMQVIQTGDTVKITFLRGGEPFFIEVEMMDPPYDPKPEITILQMEPLMESIKIANMSPGIATEYGISTITEEGVVSLSDLGTSNQIIIQRGDIFLNINNVPIKTIDDAKTAVKKSKNVLDLKIQRGNQVLQERIQKGFDRPR